MPLAPGRLSLALSPEGVGSTHGSHRGGCLAFAGGCVCALREACCFSLQHARAVSAVPSSLHTAARLAIIITALVLRAHTFLLEIREREREREAKTRYWGSKQRAAAAAAGGARPPCARTHTHTRTPRGQVVQTANKQNRCLARAHSSGGAAGRQVLKVEGRRRRSCAARATSLFAASPSLTNAPNTLPRRARGSVQEGGGISMLRERPYMRVCEGKGRPNGERVATHPAERERERDQCGGRVRPREGSSRARIYDAAVWGGRRRAGGARCLRLLGLCGASGGEKRAAVMSVCCGVEVGVGKTKKHPTSSHRRLLGRRLLLRRRRLLDDLLGGLGRGGGLLLRRRRLGLLRRGGLLLGRRRLLLGRRRRLLRLGRRRRLLRLGRGGLLGRGLAVFV